MSDYVFKINCLRVFGVEDPIIPKKINVLIGPNNSGKSTALKEIRAEILGHPGRSDSSIHDCTGKIFEATELNLPSCVEDLISSYQLDERVISCEGGGWRVRDYCNMGKTLSVGGGYVNHYRSQSFGLEFWKKSLQTCLTNPENYGGKREATCAALRFFGPSMVDYVGTDDRLLFSLGDQARGCKDNDYNSLSSVLDSDPDCNGISKDVRELFHKDVVLDSVSSRQVVVPVVSESFDEYRAEKDMAKKLSILEHATPLYEEGDGFRSFVSILLSVIGRKKPIMLLDEPEAFLHPPYAKRMGEMLAVRLLSNEHLESAFIATHSSYLLRGLLEGHPDDLQVIRLERTGDAASARVLNNDELVELINRNDYSPKYLDGLFSSEVNLVEAPWDELIYSRIAMKAHDDYDGLFVPVNGKHRFAPMKHFYDSAGLRCRAIADFDLLDDAVVFRKTLGAFGVDGDGCQAFLDVRTRLEETRRDQVGMPKCGHKDLPKAVKKLYKVDALKELPEDLIDQLNEMICALEKRDLIVLRTGELESIFVEDGIAYTHLSDEWLQSALGHIASIDGEQLARNSAVAPLLGAFGTR